MSWRVLPNLLLVNGIAWAYSTYWSSTMFGTICALASTNLLVFFSTGNRNDDLLLPVLPLSYFVVGASELPYPSTLMEVMPYVVCYASWMLFPYAEMAELVYGWLVPRERKVSFRPVESTPKEADQSFVEEAYELV